MNRISFAKQKAFYNATHCHICRKPFENEQDPNKPKVRDHDNVTGSSVLLLVRNVINSGGLITTSPCSSTTSADIIPTS